MLKRQLARPTILYLMMAQHCNFECTYCPIPELAKKYGPRLLTIRDAKAGIDLWAKQLRGWEDDGDEFFAIFYGGEPLLNKKTLRSAATYIRQLQQIGKLPRERIRLLLSTNGSLLDAEMARFCRDEEIAVVVGIDGIDGTNDLTRVDRLGQSTFARIKEAFVLLSDHGVPSFASVTVTPGNLDELGELSSFLRSVGVEKVGLNFLKGRALVQMLGGESPESFYRRSSRVMIQLFLSLSEPSFEYQIEKKRLAFCEGRFFPPDCTCYGNQVVIQADGRVTNCPFHRHDQGHVRALPADFRIAETQIVQNWQKRILDLEGSNRSFHGQALSGGGCAWSSLEQNGNCLAPDLASQIFTEEVFDELIWTSYTEGA
ncbi:MAG: radical SAM protein [Candidatus Berkelbacteria bacterium]|nr:radical SAM protein [Candidatus Berkelbacteria bacterium]